MVRSLLEKGLDWWEFFYQNLRIFVGAWHSTNTSGPFEMRTNHKEISRGKFRKFPKCEPFKQVRKFWQKNEMEQTPSRLFFDNLGTFYLAKNSGLNFQEWEPPRGAYSFRELNNTRISRIFSREGFALFTRFEFLVERKATLTNLSSFLGKPKKWWVHQPLLFLSPLQCPEIQAKIWDRADKSSQFYITSSFTSLDASFILPKKYS